MKLELQCWCRMTTVIVLSLVSTASLRSGVAKAAEPADATQPAAGDELSVDQARLADRFARLETVIARLAELSAGSDPRRAKVLREAIAKSREEGLEQRFESIVSLLEGERLSAATGRQVELQKELDELLTLLLKADRDRELDSERKRIKAYLKEVGRLIRLEKGLQARTEGGDETKRLAADQKQVSKATGELSKSIGDTQRSEKESKKADGSEKADQGDQKGDESKEGQKSDGKKSDGKSREAGKPSESQKSGSGKLSEGQPAEGKPAEGKQSQGQPSQPGEQGQQGQQGQPGQSSPSDSSQQSQEPTDRAAERVKQAQQAMEEAQKQLEEAKRDGAAESQREALKQLEQAKAELERVLRQLREEEMERTLTMLAARFRKMLEAQIKIYEGTKRLDKIPEAQRDHDEEIEAARLSREESLIVREADRALVLLREEGSSLAFPETVGLMREDMQQVTGRLADAKVGALTQELEQDIIEALEETIAALEKAIKDLDKKKTPPGQAPQAGQPGDPPLVDKLAELKMIRSLQMRINRRTMRYGKIIEGEQAETPELLEALSKLSLRQQRVYQATNDLAQGKND